MFSPLNYMDEDLLAQTSFTGLVSTIFSSIYYINGFDSLSLCLNPSLGAAGAVFEDQIHQVIRCGAESKDRILTDTYFPKSEMLPELYEPREYPAAYYFMPLYYEDTVFGYAAISYGDCAKVIPPDYRAWLRSVSRGIECYRRADELIGSNKIAKKGVTTDSLTGLANYLGFLEQSETLLHLMRLYGRAGDRYQGPFEDQRHLWKKRRGQCDHLDGECPGESILFEELPVLPYR